MGMVMKLLRALAFVVVPCLALDALAQSPIRSGSSPFTGDLDGGALIDVLATIEASTAGSGAPNVLTASESGKTITNEGATAVAYNTLPTAVAGYRFCFRVQDAEGMRVTASAGDTIQLRDYVTSTGGYIQSTLIGSQLCLEAINTTEWILDGDATGDWLIDGTVTHYLGGGLYQSTKGLTATTIVGTAAGDIGTVANGFELVASKTGKIILPARVVIQYTFATGSYADGGNVAARWQYSGSSTVATSSAGSTSTFADADSSNTTVLVPVVANDLDTTTNLVGANLQLVTTAAFTAGTGAGTAVVSTFYNLVTP
jgi:hypothetical protein